MKSRAPHPGESARLAGRSGDNKQHFGRNSHQYAKFRPGYPVALTRSLAALASNHQLALDVGCGSGQLTTPLAAHFDRVIGIDSSYSQLRHAASADNVAYQQHSAECFALRDNSADLIVAAQAAHWFNLDSFYAEVRRVARESAILALLTYGVPRIVDPVDAVLHQGYWQDTHAFWPPERRQVENGYQGLDFPFAELAFPAHHHSVAITREEFIGYIKTWSAYQLACERHQQACFERLFDRLRQHWQQGETKKVIWPISVRAARIGG